MITALSLPRAAGAPPPLPAFEDAAHLRAVVDKYVSGNPTQRVLAGLGTAVAMGASTLVPGLVQLATRSIAGDTGSVVAGCVASLIPAGVGVAAGCLIHRRVLKQPGYGDAAVWIGFLTWGGGLMNAPMASPLGLALSTALWTTVGFACGMGAARSVDRQAEKELQQISHTLDQAIELGKLAAVMNKSGGKVEKEQQYVIINGIRVPKGGRS